MFLSPILDVAAGLSLAFLAVSLVASCVVEAIASALKWRSAGLLAGIRQIVNDPKFDGLAKALYDHALVNPREDGDTTAAIGLKPAYVAPVQFADAMLEIVGAAQPTVAEAMGAIDASPLLDDQLRTLLRGMVARTGADAAKLRDELARWFDGAMDRVSGAYKRRAQLASFLVTLAMAAALNVDALHVANVLWTYPVADPALQLPPGAGVGTVLDHAGLLPIGWQPGHPGPKGVRFVALAIPGWVLTAVASLFGAPFWFDALQTVVRLKGAGPSPAEKKKGRAAAA